MLVSSDVDLLVLQDREDHGGIKFQGMVTECDVCCLKSDLFAVGPCLHPICIECGIRLRVLCSDEKCPKCRSHVETVTKFCSIAN